MMNKARLEAIESERINDPLKFKAHAHEYWTEALPVLKLTFDQPVTWADILPTVGELKAEMAKETPPKKVEPKKAKAKK